ncbi:NUDIX hydrolase [Pseudomonas oryzihabitans]|uniref:8-oxo-dGTP diphosphatase n=1 Tax=Pseudomonas oryzihabitans TaxID=47885 RepID=A0AAJ2BJ22_9PSED|nr:NUDIX hydrolase [Pseudomonas psychrotolerans]MDR6233335.1 8-oxo-dGTP diphosphatase [Pseudomonas psychrotolerans]MDR6357646.1 8-oxo-dGTP diphosphatase [Pseudomonas psychrotolerans]
MSREAFNGAKLALLCDDQILVYQRDDKPSIPWPGLWDLPGGGREDDETPERCALRELEEEFSLVLDASRLTWGRCYPPRQPGYLPSWLFAGQLSRAEIAAIRFGDEGQYWQLMSIADFLAHPQGVPHLQERLRDYLEERRLLIPAE